MASIPIEEFARRLCIAEHPTYAHAGPANRVPCGQHLYLARNYWGLLDDRPALLVVIAAAGLSVVEKPTTEEIGAAMHYSPIAQAAFVLGRQRGRLEGVAAARGEDPEALIEQARQDAKVFEAIATQVFPSETPEEFRRIYEGTFEQVRHG